MEKNQATGLILISILLFIYLFYFSPQPVENPDNSLVSDTTSLVPKTTIDEIPVERLDSLGKLRYGPLASSLEGKGDDIILENNDIQLVISSKGGIVKKAILKKYVTYTKQTLVLFDEESSKMSEFIPTNDGKSINIGSLYFKHERKGDVLSLFIADTTGARLIEKNFRLPSDGYMLFYGMNVNNVPTVVSSGGLAFSWSENMKRQEMDIEQSRIRSTINYFTIAEELDYLSETSKDKEAEAVASPVKWVSIKQKFFNTGFITEKQLSNLEITSSVDEFDTAHVKKADVAMTIPLADLAGESQFKFYFGPNDYDICATVANGYQKNVYLGWSIFSYINLYLIIPVFKFLEGQIVNYGIIILILVLIVKTLLFPLTYRSYVSMAKMKVLKPEIDALKAKHGDDQQKLNVETMKLYGEFGVNPLSGCIPMLAQMPVFLALFNFFPNAIQLRQKEFLWATDLSSYDSILDLAFTIPMYGSHVSGFTILMTATTILTTYMNADMNSSAAQGPMKTMMYIMPIMFMLFLNSFSAGLTYYYFVSNVVTIAQQFITKAMVDDSSIREKLEKNKEKRAASGKGKSSFSQQLDKLTNAKAKADSKKKSSND